MFVGNLWDLANHFWHAVRFCVCVRADCMLRCVGGRIVKGKQNNETA